MKFHVVLLFVITATLMTPAVNSKNNNSNLSSNSRSISNNSNNTTITSNTTITTTITHANTFDTKLNHLVVDKNTGRVSSILYYVINSIFFIIIVFSNHPHSNHPCFLWTFCWWDHCHSKKRSTNTLVLTPTPGVIVSLFYGFLQCKLIQQSSVKSATLHVIVLHYKLTQWHIHP